MVGLLNAGLLTAGLTGLMTMAAGPAQAEVTQVIRHYDVWGADVGELKNAIRASAPLGGRAFGLTNVKINPQFAYLQHDNGCVTANVVVDLDITVTLPKWLKDRPVPAALNGQWVNLEATVRDHEMQHVEIAQDFAARIEQVIAEAESGESCATLEQELTAKVQRLQAAHRVAQKLFDLDERERLKALLP